jgi:hypothetical protein
VVGVIAVSGEKYQENSCDKRRRRKTNDNDDDDRFIAASRGEVSGKFL